MSLQSQLLKEGTRHLAGVDEAVLKNIDAVREMSKISRTSLGPQGTLPLSLSMLSAGLFTPIPGTTV